MTHRLSCITFVAILCAAAPSFAQPGSPVRLRARTFVPPANVAPGARLMAGGETDSTSRRHILIQFSAPVDAGTLSRLRRAGATPLRYVPENTVAVVVGPDFEAASVEGARWVGELEPADRLSEETASDLAAPFPGRPLTVVQFHPDVVRSTIESTLQDAGTRAVPLPALPAYTVLIPTDATAIHRLSTLDAVAWIYPAAPDLDTAAAVAVCGGAVAPGGIVADYATMGEGWDGPGLGTARLRYFLSRPSSDLEPAAQVRELTRAMAEWSRYVAITWQPGTRASEGLSVHLLWGALDHGDEFPFTADVLAHAFYPSPPVPEPIAGDVHFNDTLLWGVGDPRRWDVFSVALHELGHSLGLMHADDPQSVMYPMYRGVITRLADTDIRTIRQLYASAGPGTLPTGWASTVVGEDDAGEVLHDNGRFIVAAGGRDIWDRADEFRFVSQPLRGDGDIVARVDSLLGTHRWSKAGVMIRGTAGAGAPHGFAVVSRDRGLAFQRRRSAGGLSLSTDGGPGTAPRWLWLSRRGDRIEAYGASDGGQWRLIGSDVVALGHEALAGLAVTSHDEDVAATAVFSGVSVRPLPPSRWMAADIGNVGRPGGLAVNGSRLHVRGAGDDIWDRADAFHFVWQTVEGDVDIVGRLATLTSVRAWTKAGVMIRGGLDPGAAHAHMLGSAGKGFAFQRRTATNGLSAHTAGGAGAAPGWIKLSRRGNRITASRSPDGRTWTVVGSDEIALGRLAFVGLAVSSHTAGATAEAVFESVVIQAAK